MTRTSLLLILTHLWLGQTISGRQIVLLCVKLSYVKKRMWDEDWNGGFKNHIEIRSGFVKSNNFKWTYLDFVCFEQEVNNLWDYALEIKCWSCRFIFHSVMWCLVWPIVLFYSCLFVFYSIIYLQTVNITNTWAAMSCLLWCSWVAAPPSPALFDVLTDMHLSQSKDCVCFDRWVTPN